MEHPFRVIKRQFGFARANYRGLAKIIASLVALFALSDLWTARKRLFKLAQIGVRPNAFLGPQMASESALKHGTKHWYFRHLKATYQHVF